MNVEFICPHCKTDNKADSERNEVRCKQCREPVALNFSEHSRQTGEVDRCALCGNEGFYLQKDFNPRLGILIFVLGVLFSYHTKFISLFIATAIDFALYYLLPTVTVCYQCRAIYRGFSRNEKHEGFNHLRALKYSKTAT